MRIFIYGCGKMAEAMLARWLEVGALRPEAATALVRTPTRAAELQARHGVQAFAAGVDEGGLAVEALRAAVASADLVLVAVKPQQLPALAADLRALRRPGQLWISVLAGKGLGQLGAIAPGPWQRWMPNTPSRRGRGLVGRCCSAVGATEPDVAPLTAAADALAAALGAAVDLPEDHFDAFTAVAGSGPAYVFAFVEALAAAASHAGFEQAKAVALARDVVIGAAALLAADERAPADLRAEVTSPGGTTAAALEVLSRGGLDALVSQAVGAAAARSRALAGP